MFYGVTSVIWLLKHEPPAWECADLAFSPDLLSIGDGPPAVEVDPVLISVDGIGQGYGRRSVINEPMRSVPFPARGVDARLALLGRQ